MDLQQTTVCMHHAFLSIFKCHVFLHHFCNAYYSFELTLFFFGDNEYRLSKFTITLTKKNSSLGWNKLGQLREFSIYKEFLLRALEINSPQINNP